MRLEARADLLKQKRFNLSSFPSKISN